MIFFTLGKGMKYLKGAVLARTRWNMEYVRFLNKNTDLELIFFNKSSTKLKKSPLMKPGQKSCSILYSYHIHF